MKIHWAVGLAAAFSWQSFGQTYYVNGTCGDNSWTGTSPTCAAPDGPKQTIQAAIPATGSATIIVAPGVYAEQILVTRENFGAAIVSIESEGGPAVTTIDAMGGVTAVSVGTILGTSGHLIVRGFTIQNAENGVSNGRFIQLDVEDSIITNCDLGLSVNSVNASSCVIEDNTVDGLRCQSSTPGAINMHHCIFRNNGERAINTNTQVTLVNSLVESNGATTMTPAITVGRQLTLKNVTVASNAQIGVNVVPIGSSPTAILNAHNSIVWGNNSGATQIVVAGTSPTVNVQYCIVQGGIVGTANMNSDPLFVSAGTGDFHLGAGSPAIDSGNAFLVPGDQNTDLDGQPRFQDDPAVANTGAPFPTYLDRGAYEAPGQAYCVGDTDDDHDVDLADLTIMLSQYGTSGTGLAGDQNRDGVVDIGDLAMLLSKFGLLCP